VFSTYPTGWVFSLFFDEYWYIDIGNLRRVVSITNHQCSDVSRGCSSAKDPVKTPVSTCPNGRVRKRSGRAFNGLHYRKGGHNYF
jgi:hypothetical protein